MRRRRVSGRRLRRHGGRRHHIHGSGYRAGKMEGIARRHQRTPAYPRRGQNDDRRKRRTDNRFLTVTFAAPRRDPGMTELEIYCAGKNRDMTMKQKPASSNVPRDCCEIHRDPTPHGKRVKVHHPDLIRREGDSFGPDVRLE